MSDLIDLDPVDGEFERLPHVENIMLCPPPGYMVNGQHPQLHLNHYISGHVCRPPSSHKRVNRQHP